MLQYLFSPTKQFTYESGKLLDGGKIYVYIKDTTVLATLYDVDEDYVSNPIILDANGRASVKADDSYEYRLEIYTNKDVLLYTCNAFCDGGTGDGSLSVVRHDETLSGNGTSQSLLGVVNIPLAVDDTMTAYTATVDEKESLVLGVNGDWFNDTFGSALNDKVDWSSFSACCSAVKGGLANKLDISSFDLSNYYNKQEINSALDLKLDVSEFYNNISGFQTNLIFGYDENSAISSINYSALAGGGGSGDYTPWISGAKILADTQTLTDNMIVQVLSSFTLSGYKNHCIAVKGGTYRFPNRWEIASGIAETNYFMPQSSMSGYLPNSSFSSYTASIQNNLNSNWDYTNSAYSLSINNFYNKLDASAFSAYTADAGETYTLVGGDNISISSDDDEKTTTISFTGSTGDVEVNTTVQNNSATWNNKLDTTAFSTVSGSFLTAHQSLDDYYKKTETSSKQEISAAIAAIPLGDVEVNNVVHNNSATWNNKLDSTAYHELTAGTNIDIQNYVISSKDWTNEIREASANAFNEATAANPTSSTQWNSCYETVNTNSGEWQKVSNKLDTTAFESYTASDETYLLKGGYNIGVSSDDVNKETTIYYTGTNGDEQVNQVVRQYSANGVWLTAHQTIPSAKWENASDVVQTNSAQWAENTGDTAVNNFVYNNSASITSVNNSGALWNAVYNLVATYSGKWLLNGDL